jgi:hypothetical protein
MMNPLFSLFVNLVDEFTNMFATTSPQWLGGHSEFTKKICVMKLGFSLKKSNEILSEFGHTSY